MYLAERKITDLTLFNFSYSNQSLGEGVFGEIIRDAAPRPRREAEWVWETARLPEEEDNKALTRSSRSNWEREYMVWLGLLSS